MPRNAGIIMPKIYALPVSHGPGSFILGSGAPGYFPFFFFFFPAPTACRECVSARRRLRAVTVSRTTFTTEPLAWSAWFKAGKTLLAVLLSSLAVTVLCVFVIVFHDRQLN